MTLDEFMRTIPSEHKRQMGQVVSGIKSKNTLKNVLDWFKDSEAEQVKLLGSSVTAEEKRRFLTANRGLKPIFIPKDAPFIKILQKALGTLGHSRVDSLSKDELLYAKSHIMEKLNKTDLLPQTVCKRAFCECIEFLQGMLTSAYGSGDEHLSETLVTIVMDLAYAASVIESIIKK